MKVVFLVLPAVLLLAACGEKAPPADAAGTGPRPVRAIVVGPSAADGSRRYSGEVRARFESTLGFRVGGKLVERLVDTGARVKAGQPLARLDPADARLAASQAEANRALAQADLKRTEDLRARNFVSQSALDAKVTAAKAADVQAQLAKNQAVYTTLAADAPGVIAAVLAEPGQVVSAGQGVFRIARDGEREVAISLPEAALAGLRTGGAATIALWADGKQYAGKVREIAPAADPATRTFAARVAIDGAGAGLPLGMTATVGLPNHPAGERLVIPLAAILQTGDTPVVWVIGKDDSLIRRPVEIERYGDDGATVKRGLEAGERIVAAGAFKLIEGEKVRVVGR
jgi:RND family efflux transporter MFP subunit